MAQDERGAAASKLWAQELTQWVNSMPDGEASAVRLTYFHELPTHEVAAWMGITTQTVRSLLRHALRSCPVAEHPPER